ncbi:methyltransferase domain-containing protein [Ensifer sp. LBL]|uniref:methyltransferase domain-containing protein n=1 Tax=Ensifer sp. LBL TaxID=2991056 RepID=UPI003D1B2A7F
MLSQTLMEGIAIELGFWKWFVDQPRFREEWLDEERRTVDLQPEIYEWFRSRSNVDDLKVLDVGSGVVSVLLGTFPKQNITTVDPLGALYPFVFDYEKHAIPAPLARGGEEMDFSEEFDIAHISNAIDHAQNPGLVFEKMMAAVKPGGYVIVQGLVDEATAENWGGLHQFNFRLTEDGLVIYVGREGEERYLSGRAVFHLVKRFHAEARDWFIAVFKKPVEMAG